MIDAKEQVLKICEILYDKKALNIRALNVADKTIIAEWFVVCSGRATTQVRTLCDELEDKAADMGLTVLRKEGYGALDSAGLRTYTGTHIPPGGEGVLQYGAPLGRRSQ